MRALIARCLRVQSCVAILYVKRNACCATCMLFVPPSHLLLSSLPSMVDPHSSSNWCGELHACCVCANSRPSFQRFPCDEPIHNTLIALTSSQKASCTDRKTCYWCRRLLFACCIDLSFPSLEGRRSRHYRPASGHSPSDHVDSPFCLHKRGSPTKSTQLS
ncbi:hypothetical protein BDF19DRAFT_125047 [Syncephalis fuscata]|nr:hypothetical protein BDF19DRAFT_125047 [Syncephalis fuscata]